MENKSWDYSPHHKFSWWLIIAITILAGICFALSGCATNKNKGTQKIAEDVKIQGKIAGVDKSVNQETKTNLTAGGSITQSNDSKMVEELFQKYKETNDKLIESYKEMNKEQSDIFYLIIKILIVQLCALLGLFIKKDWDMGKRMLKIIGDDAEREDNK